MAMLVWTPDLDTGIAEIDHQHQRIVDYINTLNTLRSTKNPKALADVIEDLVDYTVSHFVFEETLLESAGYPFTGPHKKVHELFIRRISEMKTRFEAGEDVADELHSIVSRWLFSHIRSEDHAYVDVVKTHLRTIHGAGQSQEHENRVRSQVRQELEHKRGKKGWFARLFAT